MSKSATKYKIRLLAGTETVVARDKDGEVLKDRKGGTRKKILKAGAIFESPLPLHTKEPQRYQMVGVVRDGKVETVDTVMYEGLTPDEVRAAISQYKDQQIARLQSKTEERQNSDTILGDPAPEEEPAPPPMEETDTAPAKPEFVDPDPEPTILQDDDTVVEEEEEPAAPKRVKLIAEHKGKGRWQVTNVATGEKVNDGWLSKDKAKEMAGE